MRDLLYWARTMTVLLLVVGGGTAMPRTVGAQSGVQYRDPQGRFTFTVPSGWVTPPQRSTNAALFADSPQQPGKVLSVGEVSSERGTLDAVILHIAPVIIDHSPAYQPDPAGLRDLIVGGEPAKQFAFQAKTSPDDIPYALALTVVFHNGTAYTVSYFTLPPDPDSATAPPLQAVLDSWQFTDHETTIGVGWRRYRDLIGVERETHAIRGRFLLDAKPAAQLGDLVLRVVSHHLPLYITILPLARSALLRGRRESGRDHEGGYFNLPWQIELRQSGGGNVLALGHDPIAEGAAHVGRFDAPCHASRGRLRAHRKTRRAAPREIQMVPVAMRGEKDV